MKILWHDTPRREDLPANRKIIWQRTVVLQHLLERLNDLGRGLDEQVVVIADEIDDPNRHRANLHTFRLDGTPGNRSSHLDNALDTIHFVPSPPPPVILHGSVILHDDSTTTDPAGACLPSLRPS